MANSLPKKMKPTTSSTMFAAEEKADADMGVSFATSAAVPVTPPKTKLLGNLKKYTPTDMMEMLSVIIAYCLTYSMTLFCMGDSAFVSIKFTVQYSFFVFRSPNRQAVPEIL